MALTRLALTDFRNYSDALLAPGPGFVILTGDNGAGKTNVLEAVSLLAPGRGLRGAPLADMARSDGPGGFAVAARLGEVDLGTGTAGTAPERRQVRINGAPAAANSLSEWLSVLWLTPAMDRLFQESAGGRRRFLDRLVLALEPGHAHHSARYEAAMRARNKLLSEERWDEAWLDSLEAQMAEHGAEITRARLETINSLTEALWSIASDRFPKARLYLDNASTTALRTRLRASRKVHAAARRSTHGPNNRISSSISGRGKSSRRSARRASRRRSCSRSCSAMPNWLRRARAAARSCFSTRSRRISIPAAAPPCSSASGLREARSG
jgi:DNA replication and repair protein RecF